jgi:hypothetical protein
MKELIFQAVKMSPLIVYLNLIATAHAGGARPALRRFLIKEVFILRGQYRELMKKTGAILVLIAIVCSLILGYTRIHTEQAYKNVNIIVNEADARALANGNKMTNEAMLDMLKQHGVSQILFKEMSLGTLETQGDVIIAKASDIDNLVVSDQLPEDLPRNAGNFYVVILNDSWRDQVVRETTAKIPEAVVYNGQKTVITLPSSVDATAQEEATAKTVVTSIGVGFDWDWMQTAADHGFDLVAQMRSWDRPTEKSLRLMADDVKRVPNLSLIMFNDKSVPGVPDSVDTLYDLLKADDGSLIAPLGQIEFSDQKGFNDLAMKGQKDVVRLHTISNGEMSKFEGDNDEDIENGIVQALDRWSLAARERNMRALLVRFFDIERPGMGLDTNMNYLDRLTTMLTDEGFSLGQPYQQLAFPQMPTVLRLLAGLGVSAGLMLVLLELSLPRLAACGFVLSAAAWIGLYAVAPTTAEQFMALAGVIIFPILSCLHFLPTDRLKLPQAVLMLIKLCCISYIGAILMVGIMSDTVFMLKLSSFVGVKLAHVIPILVVPAVLYLVWTDKPLDNLRALLRKAVDYKWVILLGILAVALLIYVTRTGNSGAQLTSGEAGMRQMLTDVLGVRPRSKEFLIGYPCAILYLMYGKGHPSLWLLTVPLVIGQVSLVNTYAHIHTPLLISLQRSFNGLWLGLVVSLVAVLLVRLALAACNYMAQKIKAAQGQGEKEK